LEMAASRPSRNWRRTSYSLRMSSTKSCGPSRAASAPYWANVVAFEVAAAMIDKFAGDSLIEMKGNYDRYLELARQLPLADQLG